MQVINKVILLACYPIVRALDTAASLWTCSARLFHTSTQLPVTTLVCCLQVVEKITSSLLAYLTKRPAPQTQVTRCHEAIRQLQQEIKAQQRKILLLQSELDQTRLVSSKAQVKNLELIDKVETLKRRLKRQQEAAVPAAAAPHKAAAERSYPPELPQQQQQHKHQQQLLQLEAPGSTAFLFDAESWRLHVSVALAAAGLRWWLQWQADPAHQRIMLAIVWPASWLYGAIIFRCLPPTPGTKFVLSCCCWALLGYIGHDYIAGTVHSAVG